MDSITFKDTNATVSTTYWLPENNDDVMSLVTQAATKGQIICMRGAAHSFPIIGDLEDASAPSTTNRSSKPYLYVMLSKMYGINVLDPDTVWVQAGCHLGYDPFDPTGISTLENSLCYQLDNLGTANAPAPYNAKPYSPKSLPDLGGITHQTVGGFLSTSSSGGSTTYSFEDALMGIDFITWDGQKACLKSFKRPHPAKPNPDDPFYGAGVATMGLFGIIVSATFRLSPQYYIVGSETIEYADMCSLIDLFGANNGLPNLETFCKNTEYTRLFWWPQHNPLGSDLARSVVWQAKRVTTLVEAQEYANLAFDKQNPPPDTRPGDGLKPYEEVPYIINSPIPATLAADLLFTFIGRWPNWLLNLLGDTDLYQDIKGKVELAYAPFIFPGILDLFVTVDKPTNQNGGPQLFADRWYTGLPMDNQMSDRLMPIWFTELWIKIDQTQAVMTALKAFYDKQETTVDFSFNVEIYAAKSNEFWLSPSYNQDVIRIDVLWFANNLDNPVLFYQNFWDLLAPFNYRPHWAKYQPDVVNLTTTDSNNQTTTIAIPGSEYLASQYTKWDDWMALRAQMDPDQIFVNDYWRKRMDIKPL